MSFYKSVYFLKQNIHWCSLDQAWKKTNVWLMLMALIAVCPAVAQERKAFDVDQQLLASCKALKGNSEHIDVIPCINYVKGFLAGAWHLDQATMAQLTEKSQAPTNWEERAYQYRVGKRGDRGDLTELTSFTPFCSPDNAPEKRVIEILTKITSSRATSIEALNTQIFDALKVICTTVDVKEK